jgi:hypothetical protein
MICKLRFLASRLVAGSDQLEALLHRVAQFARHVQWVLSGGPYTV